MISLLFSSTDFLCEAIEARELILLKPEAAIPAPFDERPEFILKSPLAPIFD